MITAVKAGANAANGRRRFDLQYPPTQPVPQLPASAMKPLR